MIDFKNAFFTISLCLGSQVAGANTLAPLSLGTQTNKPKASEEVEAVRTDVQIKAAEIAENEAEVADIFPEMVEEDLEENEPLDTLHVSVDLKPGDIPSPKEQFMTTVHMEVQEPSPEMMVRARHLIRQQFQRTFDAWPQLAGKQFDVRTEGPRVVFSLFTSQDMRSPVQSAIAQMVQQLNGRVRARGKSFFYRAALPQASSGYLEVVMDDSAPKIKETSGGTPPSQTEPKVRLIQAQGVPLRDLLKELQQQVGRFSYLIPGKCGRQFVEWSYGNTPESKPQPLRTIVGALAAAFEMRVSNVNGMYIFSGNCQTQQPLQIQAQTRHLGTIPFPQHTREPVNGVYKRVLFRMNPAYNH